MRGKAFVVAVLAGAMFVVFSAEVSAEKKKPRPSLAWNAGEVALFSGYVLVSAVDFYQTSRFKELGLQEGNLIYGNPPNLALVASLKLAVTVGLFFVAHFSRLGGRIVRPLILATLLSVQAGVVIWNEAGSGGIIFRF